jgi:hypothetical protein
MFRPLASAYQPIALVSLGRRFLKDRAGKSVKPGVALVLDNVPYKVTKIVQGKRGKGGGFVRAYMVRYN